MSQGDLCSRRPRRHYGGLAGPHAHKFMSFRRFKHMGSQIIHHVAASHKMYVQGSGMRLKPNPFRHAARGGRRIRGGGDSALPLPSGSLASQRPTERAFQRGGILDGAFFRTIPIRRAML